MVCCQGQIPTGLCQIYSAPRFRCLARLETSGLELLLKGFYTFFQEPLSKVTFSRCCSQAEEEIKGTNAQDNPKERVESDSLQSY